MKTIIKFFTVMLLLSGNETIFAQDSASDCIGKKVIKTCTSVPDNVCGCDGKTYLNPCAAESAGVKRFVKGPCKTNGGDDCIVKPDPRISINCLNIVEPVCGCDGKDYDNECLAKLAGVQIIVKGKCKGKKNPPSDFSPGCGAIYNHITTQPSDFFNPACKILIEFFAVESSSAIVSNTANNPKKVILANNVIITERDRCLENIFCVPSKVFGAGTDTSTVAPLKAFNDAVIKIEENGTFEVRTKKDRFLTGGTFALPNNKDELWSHCIYNKQNYAVRLTWEKGQVDNRNVFEAKK